MKNTPITLLKKVVHWGYDTLMHVINHLAYKNFLRKSNICVKNTDETISQILKHRLSVSRYGDGEFYVMMNSGNGFQTPDEKLAERLTEVLLHPVEGHISCLPYFFVNDTHLTYRACDFWYSFIRKHGRFVLKHFDDKRTYYDTNFTRFYMDFKDKNEQRVSTVVRQLKKIWDDRDLLIVEGRCSRLGVGNDLFDNASSLHRIIAPSRNAIAKYGEIRQSILQFTPPQCKNSIILCALGMMATVLCYDLAQLGYQAIDIGHIDVEYSWYRMGAKKKCAVEGKAVNEAGYMPDGDCNDNAYLQSIVEVI